MANGDRVCGPSDILGTLPLLETEPEADTASCSDLVATAQARKGDEPIMKRQQRMKPRTLHISYHWDAVIQHRNPISHLWPLYESAFVEMEKKIRTQLREPHHKRDRGSKQVRHSMSDAPTAPRPRSLHRIRRGNLSCVDSEIIVKRGEF